MAWHDPKGDEYEEFVPNAYIAPNGKLKFRVDISSSGIIDATVISEKNNFAYAIDVKGNLWMAEKSNVWGQIVQVNKDHLWYKVYQAHISTQSQPAMAEA